MEENNEEITLIDLVSVIIKRRKIAYVFFVIGLLIAGGIFAFDSFNAKKVAMIKLCKTEVIIQSAVTDYFKIDLGSRGSTYLASKDVHNLIEVGNSFSYNYDASKKSLAYSLSGIDVNSLQTDSKEILEAIHVELNRYLNIILDLQRIELSDNSFQEQYISTYSDSLQNVLNTDLSYISISEHEISDVQKTAPSKNKLILIPLGFLLLAVICAFLVEYVSKIRNNPQEYDAFIQKSGLKKRAEKNNKV